MCAPAPHALEPSRAAAPPHARTGDAALWIALAVAFSPVAVDLVQHWGEFPWARYALVFPFLFVRCALRAERMRPVPAGLYWVVAALALELAGAFTGAIRWARPGLAIAVIGMCQRLGVGRWPLWALVLFAVPAPNFLVEIGAPGPATALAALAASGWRLLGVDVAGAAQALDAVSLFPNEHWLAIAPLCAGLAWYEGILLARPLPRTIATSAAAALLAIPIELAARAVAVGAAAAGLAPSALALLGDATWIAVAAAGVALAESHLRARRSAR
jgi:hypothetical protein